MSKTKPLSQKKQFLFFIFPNNLHLYYQTYFFAVYFTSQFYNKSKKSRKTLKTMFQDLTSLVLDIGTYKSKIGYGGDDAPRLIANSYVAQNTSMEVEGQSKYIVGDKYLSIQRENREIQSIFKHKDIDACQIDFEKYEAFVESILSHELNIDLSSYSILLSEDVSYKAHEMRHNRQKIAEFMFERLQVPNIYFIKNPVLSCFATGRSTALVCDSGESYTRAVAVHDGYCLHKSARTVPYAGSTINKSLLQAVQEQLQGRNVPLKYDAQNLTKSFKQFHLNELIRDIKHSFSSKQEQESMQNLQTISYELPDHKTITLNKNSIQDKLLTVTQAETIKGYNYKGLPSMITDTINACDIDIKKELYSNVLLTGGNMLFSNLASGVMGKVGQLAPPNAKVKGVSMVSSGEKVYSGWIGGSIVTSLSSFQSYWVGKEEWKEHGLNIIQKKCN